MQMVERLNAELTKLVELGALVSEVSIYLGRHEIESYRGDPASLTVTNLDGSNLKFHDIPLVPVDRPEYFRIA